MSRLRHALLLTLWLLTSRAHAFSDTERFAAPIAEAGGGGRYFTGSTAEGYSCKVCHDGGEPVKVHIYGLPRSGYELGEAYEVTVIWAHADKVSMMLEWTDDGGAAAGDVRLPPHDELLPSEFCEPADAEVEAASATVLPDGRTVIGVPDCGAKQLRVLWTAPERDRGPVWFSGSLVSSNGEGDMAGDGVTDLTQIVPSSRSGTALASDLSASCAVARGPGPGRSSGAGVVGLLACCWLGARRLRPSRCSRRGWACAARRRR